MEPLDHPWPDSRRNQRLVDGWSGLHLLGGVVVALVLPPFWALVVAVLFEPVEVLVIGPVVARYDIDFGHEGVRNLAMDLVFDVAGILVGAFWLRDVLAPALPF